MTSSIHILDCVPKHPAGPRAAASWVLVPAYAWQVKLSIDHAASLNAFEELVLKLQKNASYSVDQLAEKTHFHPDLINWIQQDLTNKKLLPYTQLSDGERNSPTVDIIGWVLQDPETGGLYAYFSQDFKPSILNESERDSHLIELEFGDDDKPYTKKASLLPHPNQVPVFPDIESIIQTLNRKSSREFQARLANLTPLVPKKLVKTEQDDSLNNRRIRRVSFMGTSPSRVWLPTAGVVMDKSDKWFICDPVGMGWSEQLKLRIERLEKEGDQTASKLLKFLNKKTTQRNSDQGIILKENKTLAAQRVTAAFGSRIYDYPAVAEQMESFFESWLILEKFGDNDSNNEFRLVCLGGRITLEVLFMEIGKKNPLTGLDSFLPGKNEIEHYDLVKNWAVEMGYSQDHLPKKIINVRKKWLKKDAQCPSNYYSLSSVIGGMLLQASTQNDHPLRLVAKQAPDLFNELEFIYNKGNPAAHANSNKPDIEAALSLKDKLVKIVRLLLDPKGEIFN